MKGKERKERTGKKRKDMKRKGKGKAKAKAKAKGKGKGVEEEEEEEEKRIREKGTGVPSYEMIVQGHTKEKGVLGIAPRDDPQEEERRAGEGN